MAADPAPEVAPSVVQRPAVRRAVIYGAFPLIALASTQFVQSGETNSIGFAVDGIQKAFGVSDAWIGFIPFAMNIVGIAGVLPFGYLADKGRRTMLLAIGTVIWTVAMGFSGFATGFLFLLLARMWVGGLEANSPAAISLIGDYWPVEQRSTKMSLYQLGNLVGAVTAYIVAGTAVQLAGKDNGWRWAFWVWVPFGIVSTILLLRSPEPRRGNHDLREQVHPALGAMGTADEVAEAGVDDDLAKIAETVALPEPDRVGTVDYYDLDTKAAMREIWKIKSMWYGLASITVAQLITNALAFWAIPYFKRVHHMSDAGAGGIASLLLISSIAGFIVSGRYCDSLLRRGVLNGKVYFITVTSVLGTILLMLAFASPTLWITAPLFFLGGFCMTAPVAPAETLMTDVVVCDLRGRAAMIRSIVRTMSSVGPLIVGGLSVLLGGGTAIRWALVALLPVYAIGGIICLGARKTYASDLAFAIAETRRTEPFRQARHAAAHAAALAKGSS
ncbi:MAG: MFS transporter [Actinomycetes bacterium]